MHQNSPAISIRKDSLRYSLSSSSCAGSLRSEIAAEPKTFQLQAIGLANSSDFTMSRRIFSIFPKASAVGAVTKHKDLSFHVFK